MGRPTRAFPVWQTENNLRSLASPIDGMAKDQESGNSSLQSKLTLPQVVPCIDNWTHSSSAGGAPPPTTHRESRQ